MVRVRRAGVWALLVMTAAGCGASAAAGSAVVGRVGDLAVIHPFLPDPASPAVASVYLTVRNSGSSPDRLISVVTDAAASSMLMTEDPNGTMAPLVDLLIPAHGQASLTPGHDHLMLENPESALKVGQVVAVTLRFARAGTLTVQVPVVPLTAILNDGDSMSGMKGM